MISKTSHPKVFPTFCPHTRLVGVLDVIGGSVGNSYRMGSFLLQQEILPFYEIPAARGSTTQI